MLIGTLRALSERSIPYGVLDLRCTLERDLAGRWHGESSCRESENVDLEHTHPRAHCGFTTREFTTAAILEELTDEPAQVQWNEMWAKPDMLCACWTGAVGPAETEAYHCTTEWLANLKQLERTLAERLQSRRGSWSAKVLLARDLEALQGGAAQGLTGDESREACLAALTPLQHDLERYERRVRRDVPEAEVLARVRAGVLLSASLAQRSRSEGTTGFSPEVLELVPRSVAAAHQGVRVRIGDEVGDDLLTAAYVKIAGGLGSAPLECSAQRWDVLRAQILSVLGAVSGERRHVVCSKVHSLIEGSRSRNVLARTAIGCWQIARSGDSCVLNVPGEAVEPLRALLEFAGDAGPAEDLSEEVLALACILADTSGAPASTIEAAEAAMRV